MACSSASSQIFNVMDYGPCGISGSTNLQLSRGLTPGIVLNVIASTTHRSNFDIKDAYGNILLHVNPRIDAGVVVFNTLQGSWGSEERPSLMPIQCGVKYCLHIVYQSDGYRIFINGEELHFYKHRCYNPATLFELNNGQLFSVSYKLNEPRWAIPQINRNMIVQEFGCGGINSPHEMQLQGYNPLSWILITGIVNCNAERIGFNLMSSCGQIIFHFNPRFADNCVVRNSRLRQAWGNEERNGGFPFQKNQKFALAIVVESQCYRTYINGEEFITYNHRHSTNTIAKLHIEKDVQLFKITYQK